MGFAAGTIWHGWSSGATDFGGGFDPTNGNFLTDLTTDSNTANTASPVVSSASYNFVAGDVGAWVFIQSGTNWTPGWYQIASVASNKATLTASVGSAVLYGTSATSVNYQRPNGLNTAAGCATVGTPTGGVWSIDYSQQTSAKTTYTDLVIDGTTNTDATSAAAPFGKQQLGNIVNITSGTGFTVQRVQLVSIPSGVIGRFDKSLGTLSSTGGNGKLGGAIGSTSAITALTQSLVAGNKVFLKGTFTLTATTTVTASAKGDTTSGRISVEGFATYPGQRDGRPTITSATNSVALFTLNDNDYWEFIHLSVTHSAATRGNGFIGSTSTSTPLYWFDCICDGCLSFMTASNFSVFYIDVCEVKNCTSSTAAIVAPGVIVVHGCDIHDNTGDGIRTTSGTTSSINIFGTIFDTNAIGLNDVSTALTITTIINDCTFVDNSSDGVKFAAMGSNTRTLHIDNNVFYNNGGYGIDNLDTQIETEATIRSYRNNAFGSNSSGPVTGLTTGHGAITLTADPFTNKASRDFSPNNTAGGGAALRAAASPTTFPGGTTTSYRDVGAVQHQDSGSGGGSISSGNFFPGGNVNF